MAELQDNPPKYWFYEKNGQRIGAVSQTEIVALIKDIELRADSLVWRQGLPDWVELRSSELSDYIDTSSPPALPGAFVNNTFVWLLAFAPLLSLFLRGFLLEIVYSGNDYLIDKGIREDELWWVVLILNIALSVWDERRLQKAGINTNAFRGWVWLVPVYLYSRARALKQSLGYFWVWIGLFLLVTFAESF